MMTLLIAALQVSACTVHVTPESVLFHRDSHPALDMDRLGSTAVGGRLEGRPLGIGRPAIRAYPVPAQGEPVNPQRPHNEYYVKS
jgi:hypothetical protein